MSRAQAHDHAPDCPDCETNLYVGRREGNTDGWKCWRCGGWWHDEDADEDAGRLVADGAGHVLIRPANTRSDHVYHHPDPDDPDRPRCKATRGGTEARRYARRAPEALDDRYRLCAYCDPEWEQSRNSDDMQHYRTLAEADDLEDLRADGGREVVTVDASAFEEAVERLGGIADDLHGSGLEVSAAGIQEEIDRLQAGEVDE